MDRRPRLPGPPPRYTRVQIAEAAGLPRDLAGRVWLALGFAALADDAVAYTDADLDALLIIKALLDSGSLDERGVIQMARAFGRTTSRLARWQREIMGQDVVQRLPDLEFLLLHVWRAQLAPLLVTEDEAGQADLGIGFADVVAFTRTARDLDPLALADLVESFEGRAADVIAAHGGRLVKTLGDEVLFSASDPAVLARIAVELAEPGLRVGLAFGPVLTVMGDVFGTTVNLAARLTAIAHPGAVLADERVARGAGPGLTVVRLRERPARGLGEIQPYVVRRATSVTKTT